MTVIDDRLGAFDGPQRAALEATVAVIRKALPGAVEVLSYNLPTFKAGDDSGPQIISIDGFKDHNSLFPYGNAVAQEFPKELAAYPQTKGSIHFDRDRPFPAPLLKRMLKARIRIANEAYPKKNGEFREYYDNGFLKAIGRVKGDEPIGAWRWYRRDGVIMRSGTFKNGQQRGEWTTYDRSGAVHKVTDFG